CVAGGTIVDRQPDARGIGPQAAQHRTEQARTGAQGAPHETQVDQHQQGQSPGPAQPPPGQRDTGMQQQRRQGPGVGMAGHEARGGGRGAGAGHGRMVARRATGIPPADPARARGVPYWPPTDSAVPAMTLAPELRQRIDSLLQANQIVLFMKGEPSAPQCGFSAKAVAALSSLELPYAHVNVLADGEIREGIKAYGNWPTIPQLYIGGELVGGSDIIEQ